MDASRPISSCCRLAYGDFLGRREDEDAAVGFGAQRLGIIANPFEVPVGGDQAVFSHIGLARQKRGPAGRQQGLVFRVNQTGPPAPQQNVGRMAGNFAEGAGGRFMAHFPVG